MNCTKANGRNSCKSIRQGANDRESSDVNKLLTSE